MSKLHGLLYPRTPTGAASIVPDPPWHYSGEMLTVEFRTDPAKVAELLPAPLTLADENPGVVALIWADWQSCGDYFEELLDPARAQYKEVFVAVGGRHGDAAYSRAAYIWVDKNFAMANELVTMCGFDADLGPVYAGDAELDIHQNPTEELKRRAPIEIMRGFYRQVGNSMAGGTTLWVAPNPMADNQ